VKPPTRHTTFDLPTNPARQSSLYTIFSVLATPRSVSNLALPFPSFPIQIPQIQLHYHASPVPPVKTGATRRRPDEAPEACCICVLIHCGDGMRGKRSTPEQRAGWSRRQIDRALEEGQDSVDHLCLRARSGGIGTRLAGGYAF
jgi:hypothetical protein